MASLPSILELVYLIVSGVLLVLLLIAVLVGHWMVRYVRRQQGAPPSTFQPPVSLIIPCKGAEEGLAEHLQAHFQYDYPAYEIVFAVADPQDLAVPVIEQAIAANPQMPAKVVTAPRLATCVEKISNQLGALQAVDPASEAFVFADSDGVPCARGWLRALVAPLETHSVSTGFRWYFPRDRSLTANVQSAWDSTWCVYHAYEGTVWGGAMACTRATFDKLKLREHLSRGVTDDLVVLVQARAGGGTVCFAPGAMVGSRPHPTFPDFLRWAVRQAALVKMVTPRIWLRGLLVSTIYGLFYLLSVALLVCPGDRFGLELPLAALAAVALLNVWRGLNRYRIVCLLFPGWDAKTRPLRWRYLWSIPLADALAPYVAYASLFMRVIRWRGVGYRVLKDRVERLPEGKSGNEGELRGSSPPSEPRP